MSVATIRFAVSGSDNTHIVDQPTGLGLVERMGLRTL